MEGEEMKAGGSEGGSVTGRRRQSDSEGVGRGGGVVSSFKQVR